MKPIIAMILAASVVRRVLGSRWAPPSKSCPSKSLLSKNPIAAALVSLHVICLLMVSPLGAQTPADIARAARGLPEALDLQTDLPLLRPDEAEGAHVPV